MHWMFMASGLILLVSAGILTHFFRSRPAPDQASPFFARRHVRARIPHAMTRLLRKAARIPSDNPSFEVLHNAIRILLEQALLLRRNLRMSPKLPAQTDLEPRIMPLARQAAECGAIAGAQLLEMLAAWQSDPLTPEENANFPLCVGAAQCRMFCDVIRSILRDEQERKKASQLARKLKVSKRPLQLLEHSGFHSAGMAELITILRTTEQPAVLALVEQWLESRSSSAQTLAHQAAERMVRQAEEIRKAVDCLSALSKLNWLSQCEEADYVHLQLLQDPSGIYPRLTPASRLQLRYQVASLCRHTKQLPRTVISHALEMSEAAEPRSLEAYIGYWFQDAAGLLVLHSALPTKAGRIYARLSLRRHSLVRAALWSFGILTGFLFLQAGHPVFMLPFFLFVVGCIIRACMENVRSPSLPGIEIASITEELRTLVVLPVTIRDSHEAIRHVRRLKTIRHAFPEHGVDFLLLGDFCDSMTAIASQDGAIIQAASSAVAALEDSRCLYLQRGRSWNGSRHIYCARGGESGAIHEICRLIAQGECEDVIVHATAETAFFERRYAYVLVLSSDFHPAPGILEALLGAMTHPLCGHYPTPEGFRGYAVLSPGKNALFRGAGLIRPDAYLEATDGIADPTQDQPEVMAELAGHSFIPDATGTRSIPASSWETHYALAHHDWRMARWLLPWVQTPSGLIHNPLKGCSRFRLRERLRASLVPLAQCVLLLWAVLADSWMLFLLALLAPEAKHLPRRPEEVVHRICIWSLLPTRAAVVLYAIINILRRKERIPPSLPSLEIWTQGLSATVMAALGLALPGMAVPALAMALLFACFPLAHRLGFGSLHASPGLNDTHICLLDDLAEKTWQFFSMHVTESTHWLPPCNVQYDPAAGTEDVTSPEAVGTYLLSCLCAKELGIISAADAADRIRHTVGSLAYISMPLGLPCRKYTLSSLTVLDARVDSSQIGFLYAGLLTSAQALRCWLPDLPPEFHGLSADVEKIASVFELHRLYDADASLFHTGLDEDGQPTMHASCFEDENLLLSVAACGRRLIPPKHFSHLRRSCVRWQGRDIRLSPQGTAENHLLCSLFLPMEDEKPQHFIAAMQANGREGLWGQGECAYYDFDPSLRYRRAVFGLQEIALYAIHPGSVYAPYAAALALPYAPREAADALLRFQSMGALSPLGMCEAVDFSASSPALIGLYDAFHQGLILIAAAHILADAPVQRYFCSIPEIEACLPLLQPVHVPLILPVVTRPAASVEASIASDRIVSPLTEPAELHLLGTLDFNIQMDARGGSVIHDGDIPLTQADGVQFYLADEGRVYRLGSPHLNTQVYFAPGEIRIEQLCGSLKAELVCTADTVRRRALHLLTITNLSTRDRMIDVADCLLPDLDSPANTLEVQRPEKHRLSLHARGTKRTLHHTLRASVPLHSVHVCTDTTAFLGRNRTLYSPASLEEHACDLLLPSTQSCLSFRIKLALGGRGQASVWFSTSMQDHDPPMMTELPGIRSLAAMQHNAICAAAALDANQLRCTHKLSGLLPAARNRIILTADNSDMDVLRCLAAILDWHLLHGIQASLYVACAEDAVPIVKEAICGRACESLIRIAADIPNFTDAPLTLHSRLPLEIQLDNHYLHRPLTELEYIRPIPAKLPDSELNQRCTYGGLDPQSNAYVIELDRNMTTPSPWENRHVSRGFREVVDESGFRAPFHEQVWLHMEDGTSLSPWSTDLPRNVRVEPGMTIWEAWSDKLDIRLCAACMPGHRCGLRVLRVRNATDQEITLQVTVLGTLGGQLDRAPGVVTSQTLQQGRFAYMAGDGWSAYRIHPDPFGRRGIPSSAIADDASGAAALLTCTLVIPPQVSSEASWCAGYARHAEDIIRASGDIHSLGTSALLHRVRAEWAQCLNFLTVSTPEATLDLLMNVILPVQACQAADTTGLPALSIIAPGKAKWKLLQTARAAQSRDEWAELALLAADYTRTTGDTSLLDAHLPSRSQSVFACCREAVLNVPLDPRSLPLGDRQPYRCMLYALAAKALNELRPDDHLAEFSRKLLNTADTYLWEDSSYGAPLELDVQALACAAYGSNPRTRQALRTAWLTLYDPPHGLIRHQEPTDAPPLPGLPENGGMRTLDAVLCLHALLKTDHSGEAHELLQALNPLPHTDDSHRMETFRCAPYRLHGGMYASPMEAGQGVREHGEKAAALLYAVVLRDVLGLRREGKRISLHPHAPADWQDYTLTLREGASTWHISVERRIRQLTIDGIETEDNHFILHDDGRIHQVRAPMT